MWQHAASWARSGKVRGKTALPAPRDADCSRHGTSVAPAGGAGAPLAFRGGSERALRNWVLRFGHCSAFRLRFCCEDPGEARVFLGAVITDPRSAKQVGRALVLRGVQCGGNVAALPLYRTTPSCPHRHSRQGLDAC